MSLIRDFWALSIFDCWITKLLSVYGCFDPASFKENVHYHPALMVKDASNLLDINFIEDCRKTNKENSKQMILMCVTFQVQSHV